MKYYVYNHHDFWQYPMGGSWLRVPPDNSYRLVFKGWK